MIAQDSTGQETTEAGTTRTVTDLPRDATQIGVDEAGLEVHYSRIHTSIYVANGEAIVFERDDITPGETLVEYVDHLADTRGWQSLNLHDSWPDAFKAQIENASETETEDVATDGGQVATKPTPSDESEGEADVELPELHVGDHVTDRENPGATMVVMATRPDTCETYHVDDVPLADHNPEYPSDDRVVEVAYVDASDVVVPSKRYAFPRSRLLLRAAIHRDTDGGGEEAAR